MTTGVVASPPILQFTLNNGELAVNGSILTQVGGVNAATYSDVGLTTLLPNPIPLNSRGEISDANGQSQQLFLTPNEVYTFTLFDAKGNQIWQASYVNGLQVTGELLAPSMATVTDQPILASYVRTAAEISAGVTPTNYAYPPGDVRRYGAKCDGTTNDSTAINAALSCNNAVWITGTCAAHAILMQADGQILYGVGRASGIITNDTPAVATPCITMSANRQVLQNLFLNGGSVTADSNQNFVAVRNTGTRNLIQGIATSGVWCFGIDFQSALYSTVYKCNIDGFRKRGFNVNLGGENYLLNCMIFDSSLAAPTDAHVYFSNCPDLVIQHNYITRTGASGGPAIFGIATPPPGGFANTLVWITDNDIDNGQNWAIQLNGWWNVHITGNWVSWGQSSSSTGQISLTNCQLFDISDNDLDGSLLQGVGIYITTCSFGTIRANRVEYNYTNIQIDSSTWIMVTNNIVGQLTGLPPSGVPSQYNYLESNCTSGCQVYFLDNLSDRAVGADYQGITYAVVKKPDAVSSSFNIQSGNYTVKQSDANGKIVLTSSSAATLTLAGSVFSPGTIIEVWGVNGGTAYTIATGGITLLWANGTGTGTGNRTLTGVGYAKLLFYTTTFAVITGTGIS